MGVTLGHVHAFATSGILDLGVRRVDDIDELSHHTIFHLFPKQVYQLWQRDVLGGNIP